MTVLRRAARTGTVMSLAAAAVFAGSSVAIAAPAASPNGEAAKPAKTVLADATKALKAVKTVKVAASVKDGKQTIRFTFTYVNGVGSTGTFSEGRDSASIIQIGRDIYFKGNAALLGSAASSVVKGRYVHFSSTSTDGREFATFTNLRTFAGSLLTSSGGTVTVASSHLGGIPVAVVTDGDGSKAYVNGTGAPLPIKITGTKSDPGTVTFSRYNAKVTLKRPTDSVTI